MYKLATAGNHQQQRGLNAVGRGGGRVGRKVRRRKKQVRPAVLSLSSSRTLLSQTDINKSGKSEIIIFYVSIGFAIYQIVNWLGFVIATIIEGKSM